MVESYLYDALQAVQISNPSQNFFTTPSGDVLAYSPRSGTFVPLTDVLGSTIALTDSGKLYTQYKYEPFGVPTTSGQSSNYPYLFAGMEYDPTGLYHTWARYYSPRLQRFTQEDPLQFGGGDINLFAYVGSDPVNFTDPLGLEFCFYGFAGDAGALSVGYFGNFQGAFAGDFAAALAAGLGEGAAAVAPEAGATSAGAVAIGGGTMAAGISPGGSQGASSLGVTGVSDGQIVLTQSEKDEDPMEEAVEQSRAWNEIFGGKTPVIPYGGLDVPTERGTFHIEQGTGIGPARNGRGYRFNYGRDLEIRVMGPRPESPWNAPNGYVEFFKASQAVDPSTGRTLPKSLAHYKILP